MNDTKSNRVDIGHRKSQPISYPVVSDVVPCPSIILVRLVYIVEVFTGGKAFAGTDATIQLTVRGSSSETRRLPMTSDRSDLFEQNQLDTFAIVGRDIGELVEMT